jgi:hypothetical protein
MTPEDAQRLLEAERARREKGRNRAVFFALLAFVALVYAVTVVKIKLGIGP